MCDIQMCYDQSGGGIRFRTFNSIGMAWWHTYKHTCFQLLKVFSTDVFAPIWHHLYPGHHFYAKPGSFACVQAQLMQLHLAYPSIQHHFENIIEQEYNPACYKMLMDLKYLMEVAIPVVSSVVVLCLSKYLCHKYSCLQ